jgi:hypothetical protein
MDKAVCAWNLSKRSALERERKNWHEKLWNSGTLESSNPSSELPQPTYGNILIIYKNSGIFSLDNQLRKCLL